MLGDEAINALVLVGIVFSHHALIEAMQGASSRSAFSGRIERDSQLSGKAYTNFSHILDQLGFATSVDKDGVNFNLRPMFEIYGLGPVARELLELKLVGAGWDKARSIEEEIRALKLNQVFGVDKADIEAWLSSSTPPSGSSAVLMIKDEGFFAASDEGVATKAFAFRAGHIPRAELPITKRATPRTKANRLHNELQNKLYVHLCKEIGEENVGTEVDTGGGTTIDLVTRTSASLTFYEIKTGSSVRTSIRQAVPQLLEYAYWPDQVRAERLVIVSHLPITKDAKCYLEHIRTMFEAPIYYQQFDLAKKALV